MQKLLQHSRCGWRSLTARCLMLLAALWPPVHAQSRDAAEYFFDQTLGDFSEELELAKEQGKQGILIMFEMDECPFCHRMKDTILNQVAVQDYFRQHFLIFSVDIEGDIEVTDFEGKVTTEKAFAFRQNRVRATPVFAFFDLRGKRVARYTGATSSLEEFMQLGQYVVGKHYQRMSFTRYKLEQQRARLRDS